MWLFVLTAIFEKTNAERSLCDCSQALSIRDAIFAIDNEITSDLLKPRALV